MKIKLSLLLALTCRIAAAQDIAAAHKLVDTLTSPYFWGRGYTNDGVGKAGRFLTTQFQQYGLQPLKGKNFAQTFSFNVNTFPGKMEVSIDGVSLVPGKDFLIGNESRGFKGEASLVPKDSVTFIDADKRVMVSLEKKLTWSVEQQVGDYTLIQVDKKALTKPPASISINIENKLINNFKADNICAMVPGTAKPDSFIVYTAHYDHLGGMGSKTYFPGANDNASGVSLLMGLAKYYASHPQRYSMVFICFAGEELGLLGSKYFTEHPLMPLSNIRFLTNLDLEGTGEEGITVVNATVYPAAYNLLKQINTDGHLLAKVASRGKAANSDHYFFTEKDVPAIYIYTMGGIKAYHDIYDISATLPLNEYEHLFKLFVKFNEGLMQQ
jgi:aminopeptidase YwaD